MRVEVPEHRISFDPATDFALDELEPAKVETYGVYIRSLAYGVFLNVRSQSPDEHALTAPGLSALLASQNWASPPMDEWNTTSNDLLVAGALFDTVDMGGEVVLEVFVTDGRRLVNIAGPGPRAVMNALTPAVRRLAKTFRLE